MSACPLGVGGKAMNGGSNVDSLMDVVYGTRFAGDTVEANVGLDSDNLKQGVVGL